MKINRKKIVSSVGMVALIALSTTFGSLRADNGMCNGISLTLPFTDVAGNIFFCQIAEAYFSGLTNGTSATSYSPTAPVSREQMAAFITRTLDQSLKRGSRRAVLGQWWTQQFAGSSTLTVVGNEPQAVQSDGECLWVVNRLSGTVTRVRASDSKVIETWTGMTNPVDLLVANGRIYVIGKTAPGKLYSIDPSKPAGNAVFLTDLGDLPVGLAYDGERILTANEGGSITNYHVPSGSKITYTNNFPQPGAILYDGSDFWVIDRGLGTLRKINVSGQILQDIFFDSAILTMTFDGTNIWAVSPAAAHVIRAATGTRVATVTGNGLNTGTVGEVAFDGERILITIWGTNTLSLWRAADLAPLGTFSTGAGTFPTGVCSDGINFWVTLSTGDKLLRF